MSGQVGYYEQFLISGTKRGILYGKQKHDPRGRPGKAEQRGCDLQSPRGVLYQSDRGAGYGEDPGTGLQYDKEIRERYFALTQKPLIACMKDACNRYLTAIGENRGK